MTSYDYYYPHLRVDCPSLEDHIQPLELHVFLRYERGVYIDRKGLIYEHQLKECSWVNDSSFRKQQYFWDVSEMWVRCICQEVCRIALTLMLCWKSVSLCCHVLKERAVYHDYCRHYQYMPNPHMNGNHIDGRCNHRHEWVHVPLPPPLPVRLLHWRIPVIG